MVEKFQIVYLLKIRKLNIYTKWVLLYLIAIIYFLIVLTNIKNPQLNPTSVGFFYVVMFPRFPC